MSTSQQTDPLIGRLVDGRYRVRARIARGGMATVYVATDLRLERRVALKVMHSHLSDDSVFQSRFVQEARAAARLADPHVVNVFDQGEDGEMAYLVMEYLPGITLRELMREQRRLSVSQTITVMHAVLSGLAAAHRAGIVHRDVKPENVLLAEDGRIKIGDFGLARATSANTATGQMLLGTIAYLAPELVTRGTADARSDIYALGIMLYEMLVGEQPYQGEQPMQIAYQHATDSVPRPSAKNPGVPEPLDELVLWATEREPDERPSDARAMLERLREIEKELGVSPQVVRTTPVSAPVGDDEVDSGELTKVMPGTFTSPTAVQDVDNATRLRQRTKRNVSKGAWLFVLVVLLAGLAGGAGWWFGSGPGSQIAVPQVAGNDFATAQAILAEAELVAVEASENSLDVPAGTVVRTDPEQGARVDAGAQVAVYVSLGPAEVSLGGLNGMPESDARTLLQSNKLTVPDSVHEFDAEVARDAVIWASVTPRDGSEDIDCTGECVVHQGDTATLAVSVGALPDVKGRTPEDATGALKSADLSVNPVNAEAYDDEVATGRVVGLSDRPEGGRWRPGDTVQLVVSKGPEPIAVPNVVGDTLSSAAATLRGAGFKVSTTLPETILWDIFTVASTDPAPGSLQPKGTTISLRVTG